MEYKSAKQIAVEWGVSKRRVQVLCAQNRISGAKKIGNMWIIPGEVGKPTDMRKGMNKNDMVLVNGYKTARSQIKRIVQASIIECRDCRIPVDTNTKKALVARFSAEILISLIGSSQRYNIEFVINELIGIDAAEVNEILELDFGEFREFLEKYSPFIDDTLSWAYQFLNDFSYQNEFRETQFFTEKYMINHLIDANDIDFRRGHILDPACGGGNFLIHTLDVLSNIDKYDSKYEATGRIDCIIENIYGYEIDPLLAIVANINLRIKKILLLKASGFEVSVSDFKITNPHIYTSKTPGFKGSLDDDIHSRGLVRIGTDDIYNFSKIFNEIGYIYTNPPFETIKGMNESKKLFLNSFFPDAKCDMCNAFIQRSLEIVMDNGICGLVTQTSWLYLDSFKRFRKYIFDNYTIKSIVELGSNAFYNINGEKANVLLLKMQRKLPELRAKFKRILLSQMGIVEKELMLSNAKELIPFQSTINQNIISSNDYSYSMAIGSTTILSGKPWHLYSCYAVPMQGTSTGNNKDLVKYFWERNNESEWVLVSKGGGYSRWIGLNQYIVKWGETGEVIRATPGSALRNVKHFKNTALVFSDTGTAGLNVRLLLENQIFIASGPGIRIKTGTKYAHLAFLNSRYATYWIKQLSPKLTIAAGYISKIPVMNNIFNSEQLTFLSKECISLKTERLINNPTNFEFLPIKSVTIKSSVIQQALEWFKNDMANEWNQLCCERKIEDYIFREFDMDNSAVQEIKLRVGDHACEITTSHELEIEEIDKKISKLLSHNCVLNRTLPNTGGIGCDGVMEYLAHKERIAPKDLNNLIENQGNRFVLTLGKYSKAFMHNLVLSLIGYSPKHLVSNCSLTISDFELQLISKHVGLVGDLPMITNWIRDEFNSFHSVAFIKKPIARYNPSFDTIEMIAFDR